MAKLTAKVRNKIPGKDFAGPDRSYPIEDASHARNALARSAGKPVHARVEAAVHRKYPGMGKQRPGHNVSGSHTTRGHQMSGMESAMHASADKLHPVGRK